MDDTVESHSHGSPSLLKQTVSSLYDTGLICMLQNLPDLFLPDHMPFPAFSAQKNHLNPGRTDTLWIRHPHR